MSNLWRQGGRKRPGSGNGAEWVQGRGRGSKGRCSVQEVAFEVDGSMLMIHEIFVR